MWEHDVWQIGWNNMDGKPTMYDFEEAVSRMQGVSRVHFERVVRSLPDPQKFLEQHRERYTWAPAVLRAGREFRAEETGKEWKMMEHSQCYRNAARRCFESNGRIKYVEGIAIAPFGIMLHAWNVERGKVVDSTWPLAHCTRYFGVVFSPEWLDYICLENGGVFSRWNETHRYIHRTARR